MTCDSCLVKVENCGEGCDAACEECGYHFSLCDCVTCDRCDDEGFRVDTEDDTFRVVYIACACKAGDEWRRDQSERRELAEYNHSHRAGAL
jgi:hypothetical protein